MSATTIRRTWEDREFRLLEADARAEEDHAGEPLHSLDSRLSDATGLPDDEVQLGLRALYEAAYIFGNNPRINQRIFDLIDIRLLEKGRRTVGQWPPEDQYDAFVAVLDQQIASAPTEEERSRLERMRDVALGMGRDVLTSVLAAWAKQGGGLKAPRRKRGGPALVLSAPIATKVGHA